MFYKATDLKLLEGTTLILFFKDGAVRRYDMSKLFTKYPQFKALKDRKLFLSGKLCGYHGIVWNDELDIAVEYIYENGDPI